ncbi:uncharacterized protein [Blastocystis hominis]|uniref:RNA helicase n=1 Tax=Blastocystis hominis TaxID=12968 RepID=D8M7Y3_BLAHO|nr:uncharacterized protein [Blastocystis hominis]CBK24172.2 unnamed protein product [Blastocystis hominis]|eukprot:XP_012898220.1 uncharacterized protein [Blastocystis hominis]
MGYVHPTLVQEQSIPLILSGKDVLIKARTGSGKTVAYAIPTLQKLLSITNTTDGIKAVILVPSKELCVQTYECFRSLSRYCSNVINVVSLHLSSADQQKGYLNEYTDVVISTPKMLLNHLKLYSDNILKNIHTFIVDEADLLLSYGYKEDMNKVVERIPATCQNIILSATLNEEVSLLKQKLLHNCVTVKLEEENTNLNEFFIEVSEEKKALLLYALLRLHILKGKVIIFVDSLNFGYFLSIFLERFSMKSVVLNNELPALSRNNIIHQFNRGMYDYLIATDEGLAQSIPENSEKEENGGNSGTNAKEDAELLGDSENEKDEDSEIEKDVDSEIEKDDSDDFDLEDSSEPEKETEETQNDEYNVSRGIDFENVAAVINYSMPASVSHYVHRIGRTARAGNLGTALSFIVPTSDKDQRILAEIQKYNPPRDGHPVPQRLPFDISQIESFSYRRVEGVKRGITPNLIRNTRMMQLRKEALNSSKLKMHFEDNPHELELLQHGLSKQLVRPIAYLRDIPDYLIPDALKPKSNPEEAKRGHEEDEKNKEWKRKRVADPLHVAIKGRNNL